MRVLPAAHELQSRESMTIFDGVLKSMLLDSACKVSTTIQVKQNKQETTIKQNPEVCPSKETKHNCGLLVS